MEVAAYLDHIRADAARLSDVARLDLDVDVPCCPGWTVRDLVQHVGIVYRHKALIVEEGWVEPQERTISPPDDGVVEWLDRSVEHLVEVLEEHDPSEQVWTWHDDDQTVGFWYRRMAHESLIHRIDAEQALRLESSIDEDLAADGIDEILTVMMSGAPAWASCEFGDRGARFEVPGRSWTVRLGTFSGTSPTSGVEYVDEPTLELVGPHAVFQAVISGSAGSVDLWLWGRTTPGSITIQGDRSIVNVVRGIAKESTQ